MHARAHTRTHTCDVGSELNWSFQNEGSHSCWFILTSAAAVQYRNTTVRTTMYFSKTTFVKASFYTYGFPSKYLSTRLPTHLFLACTYGKFKHMYKYDKEKECVVP